MPTAQDEPASSISVAIQDDRSQHKNRAKAMKILLARLQENEARKQREAQDAKRRDQIGSGDRSERIRTYNFQQGRVTDHRVGVTLHSLDQVLASLPATASWTVDRADLYGGSKNS